MNTTEIPVDRRDEPRRKRRPLIAAALAVLAVGGVGAAATSAAWTDDVFFNAFAQAATFDLKGSVDGITWMDSDDGTVIELTVPDSAFGQLLPNQARNVTLHVKNTGTVAAAITTEGKFADGATFADAPTITFQGVEDVIAPGGSNSFVLTVSTPDDWSPANQGDSGTVVVKLTGTATSTQ